MVTLATFQGSSAVPDLGRLGQGFERVRGQLQTEQEQRQLQEAQQQIFQPGASPEQVNQNLLILGRLNPQLGKMAFQIFQRGDKLEIRKLRNDSIRARNQALALLKIEDPAEQMTALLDMASEKGQRGEDPSEELRLADMSPERRKLELDTDVITGDALLGITEERENFEVTTIDGRQVLRSTVSGDIKALPRGPTAQSPAGKIESDKRAGLINSVQAKKATDLLQKASKEGNFVTSPTFLTRKPDGTNSLSVPITNRRTGETVINEIPIKGNIIERAGGQTPEERAALGVETAGLTTGATRAAQIRTAAPLAAEAKRGGAEEGRAQENITGALLAADALPQLRRTLGLLDEVETGGLAGVMIKAKRLIGQESADEGELSFNLSKNVMKQLKPTFGAAFTEKEGRQLTAIEAGISKSPAANKKLIRLAIKITLNAIQRGQRAAVNRGDQEALTDISEAMNLDLSLEGLSDEGLTIPPATAIQGAGQAESQRGIGGGEFNFNPATGQFEKVR